MAIEVTINEREVNNIISKLKRLKRPITSKLVMNSVLLKVKNNILLRTNSGKDVDFKPFKPYSSEYASEEGKTIVNLTKTGNMLNSMTQKVISNTRGKIFFRSSGYKDSTITTRDLARIHNEGDGVPKREFFGTNKKDDETALKEYRKAIKKAKKKVGL